MIKVTWLGHSSVKLDYKGFQIIMDPYAPGTVPGLDDISEDAHLVLCSHEHRDHNSRESVRFATGVINPFEVIELHSYHDNVLGAKRGPNTIHVLENDEIKIVHLGDIGCQPTSHQIQKMYQADLIFVPVGGHYTAELDVIHQILKDIDPKVIVPMHFRSDTFGYDVIGQVEPFLNMYNHVLHLNSHSFSYPTYPNTSIVVLKPKYMKSL